MFKKRTRSSTSAQMRVQTQTSTVNNNDDKSDVNNNQQSNIETNKFNGVEGNGNQFDNFKDISHLLNPQKSSNRMDKIISKYNNMDNKNASEDTIENKNYEIINNEMYITQHWQQPKYSKDEFLLRNLKTNNDHESKDIDNIVNESGEFSDDSEASVKDKDFKYNKSDILYDETLDNNDEAYVYKKYHSSFANNDDSNNTNNNKDEKKIKIQSDCTLCCPQCFTIVAFDCQKDLTHNEYRASQVYNVNIDENKIVKPIIHDDDDDIDDSNVIYNPIYCDECQTELGIRETINLTKNNSSSQDNINNDKNMNLNLFQSNQNDAKNDGNNGEKKNDDAIWHLVSDKLNDFSYMQHTSNDSNEKNTKNENNKIQETFNENHENEINNDDDENDPENDNNPCINDDDSDSNDDIHQNDEQNDEQNDVHNEGNEIEGILKEMNKKCNDEEVTIINAINANNNENLNYIYRFYDVLPGLA